MVFCFLFCEMLFDTIQNVNAAEGIEAACDWAYKGVTKGSVLEGN